MFRSLLLFGILFCASTFYGAPKRVLVVGSTRKAGKLLNQYHRQMMESDPKTLDLSYLDPPEGWDITTLDVEPVAGVVLKRARKKQEKPKHIQADLLLFDCKQKGLSPFDMLISERLFPKGTSEDDHVSLLEVVKSGYRNLKEGGEFVMEWPLRMPLAHGDAMSFLVWCPDDPMFFVLSFLCTEESHMVRSLGLMTSFVLGHMTKWSDDSKLLRESYFKAMCQHGFFRDALKPVLVPRFFGMKITMGDDLDSWMDSILREKPLAAAACMCQKLRGGNPDPSLSEQLVEVIQKCLADYGALLNKLWASECFLHKAVKEGIPEMAKMLGREQGTLVEILKNESRKQLNGGVKGEAGLLNSLIYALIFHAGFKEKKQEMLQAVESVGFKNASLEVESGPNKYNGRTNCWMLHATKSTFELRA